jgi:hypothetical protein
VLFIKDRSGGLKRLSIDKVCLSSFLYAKKTGADPIFLTSNQIGIILRNAY